MDETPHSAFAEEIGGRISLLVDFARTAEKVIAATKVAQLLSEQVADLLEVDNASMSPELKTAASHIQETKRSLLEAFEFISAKHDVELDKFAGADDASA